MRIAARAAIAFFRLIGALLLVCGVARAQQYQVTNLGALPNPISRALSINSRGDVVGVSSSIRDGVSQDNYFNFALSGYLSQGNSSYYGNVNGATSFQNGVSAAIGPVFTIGGVAYGHGIATGVNLTGQVVGLVSSLNPSTTVRAFVYSGGQAVPLGCFPDNGGVVLPGICTSIATGINSQGQISGAATFRRPPPPSNPQSVTTYIQALISTNGVFASLGLPTGFTANVATAINDIGQVAGTNYNSAISHAFLYTNGAMIDLGTLGGPTSAAYGINNAGQVVGTSQIANGDSHAFVYSNGHMTDLGTMPDDIFFLGSFNYYRALGVNNNGDIVGYAANLNFSFAETAFIYHNGVMRPLSGPAAIPGQSRAYAINDSGQIVADALGTNAYLLTPTAPPPGAPTLVDPVPHIPGETSLIAGTAITQNTNALSTGGHPVYGIATDGVTQVVLRIPTANVGDTITVSDPGAQCATSLATQCTDEYGLVFDPLNPNGPIFTNMRSGPVPVVSVATPFGPMAFAAYRAPVDFVRADSVADTMSDTGASSRTVTINITYPQVGSPAPLSIKLVRPPVVLVPGLWADNTNWRQGIDPATGDATDLRVLGSALGSDRRFQVDAADYGSQQVSITKPQPADAPSVVKGSNLGIAFGAFKTQSFARNFIADFSNGNNTLSAPVAAIQADFVGHSMGSLVTRRLQYLPLFRTFEDYNQGYVHKVISIGGPHLGSPIALNILKRGRSQDQGVDNSCTRKRVAFLEGYYTIDSYTDSGGVVQSGAIADLVGAGDGTLLSLALQQLRTGGSLPVAYMVGEMNAQELAALSGQSTFPVGRNTGFSSDYVYTFNQMQVPRTVTGLDDLKYFCGSFVWTGFNGDPILNSITADTFPGFMGNGNPSNGSSDGIVPLVSAQNGQSQFVPITTTNGAPEPAVHSGGAIALGFGVVDNAGDHPPGHVNTVLDGDAEEAVVNLLNTSVRNRKYVPLQ